MIVKSWNEVAERKNLWPANCGWLVNKLETKGGTSENEREVKPGDFVSMLKKIYGCSDIDISDINNWLETEKMQVALHLQMTK